MTDDRARVTWTSDRRDLLAQLTELSPTIGCLYKYAVDLLADPATAPDTRARLALVGHSLREVQNNLPEVFADVAGMPARKTDAKADLDPFLERVGPLLDQVSLPGRLPRRTPGSPEPVVAAPVALLVEMKSFAQASPAATTRRVERDSAVVLGHIDADDPALRPWTAARRFFMDLTHLNLDRDSGRYTPPSDAEVSRHVENFEGALHSRLDGFFAALAVVRDLVMEANSAGANSSKADVHRFLARLTNLQFRRVFYGALQESSWVLPMEEVGVFTNPPPLVKDSDGQSRADPWPEIEYVVRVASERPGETARIFRKLSDSDNPWVRRAVWEGCSRLPAEQLRQVVPSLLGWTGQSIANSRTDARDIAHTVVTLLSGNRTDRRAGVRLAEAFYAPKPSIVDDGGLKKPFLEVDQHWYMESMPEIATAMGRAGIPILAKWLENAQLYASRFNVQSGTDLSSVWFPTIATVDTFGGNEASAVLVIAIRDVALNTLSEAVASTVTPLIASNQPLLRRIGLYVLTIAIDRAREPCSPVSSLRTLLDQQTVEAVETCLRDLTLRSAIYSAEFGNLLRAAASWSSVIDSAVIREVLETRTPVPERVSKQREGESLADAQSRAAEYSDRAQHALLTAVGIEKLPSDLAARLTYLDARYGSLSPDAVTGSRFARSSGPESPLSIDAINNSSDDVLLDHLRSWSPEGATWDGPSVDGYSAALTAAIATNPGRLSRRWKDLLHLDDVYVLATVLGWRQSLQEGADLRASWGAIGAWALWVSRRPSERQQEQGTEWAVVIQLVQLLEIGLRTGGLGAPTKRNFVRALIGFAKAPQGRDEELTDDGSDALTASLNAVRPTAVRALASAVGAVDADARSAALRVLSDLVDTGTGSLPLAASFGESIGYLYDGARDWLVTRIPLIFGSRPGASDWQNVALTVALARNEFHVLLFDALRAPITQAVTDLNAEMPVAWRSSCTYPQLIGDWVLFGVWSGRLGLKDPLVTAWHSTADLTLRAEVLEYLGWRLSRWTEVSPEVLDRITSLVDNRISAVRGDSTIAQELSGFYWFVQSGKVAVEWWLPRLLEVVKRLPSFKTHGMVGEPLQGAASIDAMAAFDVVELLLAEPEVLNGWTHYDLTESAAPTVFAAALDLGIPDLETRVRALMDRLGQGGFVDLAARVESRRRASS